MKRNIMLLAILLCVNLFAQERIPLAGTWGFKEDPDDVGISQKWYNQTFSESAQLPGSMNTNGLGDPVTANTEWTAGMGNRSWYEAPEYAKYRDPNNTKVVFWLQPDHYYVGPAWYQRKINIPKDWKQKELHLVLERCHWETTVWIDNEYVGTENSLAVPQRYVLPALKPGEHTITIRVDNRVKDINPGHDAHSISDQTQTNWNGIVGEMAVEAKPKISISSVRITPSVKQRRIVVDVQIINSLKKSAKGTLALKASLLPDSSESLPELTQYCNLKKGENNVQLTYQMGDKPYLWDEFSPYLYNLNVRLQTSSGIDSVNEEFGMREISTKGTQITINDRPVFLRGTLECCVFPETGFPPTDVPGWEKVLSMCKAYGLNHIRFHSWCPPEAAFMAADRLGFYFYIECDSWAHIGSGEPIDQFVLDESERIVSEYANHPSFCMLAYGNEPSGDKMPEYLTAFVNHWKAKDRRFLCTSASGWPSLSVNDWDCTPNPRIQGWGEGIKSIINSTEPGSEYDWTSRITKERPTVSHEIGQWCVYPDLKERSQYTGPIKAKNFDIFEDRLRESGLLALADSFLMASGKLQTLCYKADIEAALRTKGFGGFELLGLNDFPGQGTALVGVVNPFWKAKEYVTGSEFSEFCNSVVPLARTKHFVLNSGETLDADIEIAQYSPRDINDASITWKLTAQDGTLYRSGTIYSKSLPTGTLTKAGEIHQKISVDRPSCFTLEVALGNYRNRWHFWVYPTENEAYDDIKVTSRLDDETVNVLEGGGKVLLIPEFGTLRNEGKDSVVVGFSSIFWNTLWTNGQAPHTLGILCDPKHPALKSFPTEYHSDYQWQDAMSHCNAIPLRKLGKDFKPIVRIIDDWFTARSLGMIVEMKVGRGKVLMCSADLLSEAETRPEARQLLNSLLSYMKGSQFNPTQEVSIDTIRGLFKASK
jgi:hypothetical protein